ncbi:tail fiber domain-containing protein [Polaribacter sp.]|nr:tail fiber domain-containing protein [Polaribacter sp.]
MKLVFTFLALTIGVFTNAQISDNSSGTTATETGSVAIGTNTTASGPFSTAMGTASIASGEKSIAIGNQYQTNATTPEYNNEAAGFLSFVIGNNNSTTGTKAFSIGTDNLSTGVSSIALGENNIASGNFSQAIGLFSESTAYSSFAIGNNAFADGYNTTAIGTANTADANADPLNWSLNNRAFVIGNGYYDIASATLNRSDALTVLFDGTTTISGSVIAPAFIGDGSQLTNLPTINSPLSLNDTSGTGMQSPTSTASGIWSTAIGYSAEASNQVAVAFGDNTTASGSRSTAMGINTLASGEYATSLNGDTIASGDYSLATGASSIASGGASTALGNYTTASGDFSTTMGNSTIASDYASTVIGQYNLVGSTVTDSEGTFNTDSPVFVIGNGTFNNRSDAVTVLFDGTTTIAGDLSINSDARLKANIISLGSTLSKLLQIDGKTYTMKRDKNQKQKIGVLAQDIEKVFPELVSESKGIKSVNYQGLVPVLINSIKEQEEKIKRLEMLVEKLLEVKK